MSEPIFDNPYAERYYQRVQGQREARELLAAQAAGERRAQLESAGRIRRTASWLDSHSGQAARIVNVPNGVPRFLGNRNVIFMAWIVAMIVIGADEWKSHHIFPRPLRFWSATVVYGILFILSQIDGLVPLTNALAIGFDISLLWEFYNGGISQPSTTASTTAPPAITTGIDANIPGIGQPIAPGVVLPGTTFPTGQPIGRSF